jgi:hypothetical protein
LNRTQLAASDAQRSAFVAFLGTPSLVEETAQGKLSNSLEGKLTDKLAYEPSSKLAPSNRVQPLPSGDSAGSDPDSVTALKTGLPRDYREVTESDHL